MTCAFFGHRSAPDTIEVTLRQTITDLIEIHGVDVFLLGNHGIFDAMVLRVLREFAELYPIKYYVVLAYMPEKQDEYKMTDYTNTILSEGIETVIKRFAIDYRNRWMIEHSDFVVTYVIHNLGSGAAKYKQLAERKGRKIIEVSEVD